MKQIFVEPRAKTEFTEVGDVEVHLSCRKSKSVRELPQLTKGDAHYVFWYIIAVF